VLPCTYDAAVVENDQPQCAPGSPAGASSLPLSISDQLTWVLVAIIASAYFFGLTPGHVFAQDDFAAYVMQAANLVEHRRYTDIRYVPNPEAPWVSPANGYPPVYPLLLVPVYWLRGLDLRAMKMATVFTFAIFLAAFAKWVRPMVSPRLRLVAVLLVGLSPAFWNYRDLISSEFPYLMFSFLALLAIRRGSDVGRGWQQAGWALLAALLLYASYGTRTIGIALPGALLCAQLMRQRKPARFVMLVLGVFAGFTMVQSVLLTSPRGYMAVAHFSTTSVLDNVASYAKSLSHAWESGFSQAAQVGLTVVFSGFAAFAFWKRIREGSLEAFYVVIYLGILIAWGAQIGVRGLLPVLPIYLTYMVLGITEAIEGWKKPKARALVAAVAVCMAITYFGGLRQRPWQAALANVNDTSAQELFTFLRSQTQPSDLLLFSKPRSLALFSGRAVGSLGVEEPAGESVRFVRENGVRFVIQSSWTPAAYDQLLASGQFELVFGNGDFRVYRVGERVE
jgi:4-amino-4-deoxy-L-arabinose transferase-like glycosyltransferase